MINLDVLKDCKKCGPTCESLPPSGDWSTAKIVVIYEQATKQDHRYGELFQNRGCYAARKELLKYFREQDLYFTSLAKCHNGNSDICQRAWLDQETSGKFLLIMGAKVYGAIYEKASNFPKNVGKIDQDAAVWYSPMLFESRGAAFYDEFNDFCKGIKNVLEKKG